MEMKYRDKRKKSEVDLMEYWRVIIKRKWVLFTFAGTLIFLVGVFSFLAAPKYESTATLLIEEGSSRLLSIEDEFGYRPQGYNSMYMDTVVNTQINILQSRSLAKRVAAKMNLLSRPEFGGEEKKGVMASVRDFVTLKWLTGNDSKKENTQHRLRDPYTEVLKRIDKSLDVSPVRNSKLVEVSYTCKSPVLASDIVNTFAAEFIVFSVEKRYETTQQASDFLSEQIADLRQDLAAKEKELAQYGQESGIFYLDENESSAVEKFADLNKAYTQAQINRINTEAKYRELRSLKVDSLPQFVDNKMIQDLKTEYSQLRNEYEEKSKVYKPSYPDIIKLKAKVDSMREELKTEIQKAVDAAESDYRSALKNESSLKRLLDTQKENVGEMKSNAILYNSLRIEVDNKRKLLNSLGERQNETYVSSRLGGLKSTNISVIDEGAVPEDPVFPKKKLNLILALLMGVFGGVGLCFVFEYFDNTVKGPDDLEETTGIPSLGIVPYLHPEAGKRKKYGYYARYQYHRGEEEGNAEDLPEIKEIELINHRHPKFSLSEDYRTIRTSILMSQVGAPPQTILISSALPKEGKSTTVANLAVSFAQLEKRVLVVDADLRKPRLHRIFDMPNERGLSSYITGGDSMGNVVWESGIENIWILPGGPIPPNPAELLNSKHMSELLEKLKSGFDIILLDAPPVLSAVDAVVLSSEVDVVLFVIQAEKTTYKQFLAALESVKRVKARVMGAVFNRVNLHKGDYSYMKYHRYYGDEEEIR
ncbi:MAG: GumC family protein [Acidobacteriota bacterium]